MMAQLNFIKKTLRQNLNFKHEVQIALNIYILKHNYNDILKIMISETFVFIICTRLRDFTMSRTKQC